MQALIYLAVALLAALLGALGGMLYQDDKWRRRKHRRSAAAEEEEEPAAPASPVAPEETGDWQRELASLRDENADLRRQKEELEYLLHKEPASPPPSRKSKNRRAPAPPVAVPAPVSAPTLAPPVAPAAQYASAIPGGYLEDAQLVAQAMSRMPLAVTFNPTDPAQATFTLSPGVDQSWLIEAGLDRLRDYFDYTLPASWPTSVVATQAGHLVREADGWRVSPDGKGRLEVR